MPSTVIRTDQRHSAVAILLDLKALAAALGVLCTACMPKTVRLQQEQRQSRNSCVSPTALSCMSAMLPHLGRRLQLCPELGQLGFELAQMVLRGLRFSCRATMSAFTSISFLCCQVGPRAAGACTLFFCVLAISASISLILEMSGHYNLSYNL